MEMGFGKIVLKCGRENVDLSRLGSRGGMPYLAGHDSEMPLGRFETMEVRNGRVEGSAQIIPTDRNEPYVQEVKAGVRPGCSPAFLLDFDKIQALEDPDNPDGFIGVIMKWHIYEASAVTTPRNPAAGLLGVRNRSGSRASIAPAEEVTEDESAEIQEKVDAEVSAQVAALEKKIAETGTLLEAGTKRQEKLRMELFSQVKNKNGQTEPETTAAMKYKAVFAAMLFGGPDPEASDVVLDYVGQTGKMGTVKLRVNTEMAAAFDTTTAHGAVTTEGGAMVADAYYEESPRRILALPRRIENIAGDQQIPTLTQEPNSAMAAQGGQG